MRWFDDLYLTEYLREHKGKRKRAIRRIKRKSLFFNKAYVLSLRKSEITGGYFFEIICGSELAKRYYPTKGLFVIGLAEDHDSACLLSCDIVMEAYEKTGEFDVAKYIAGRLKADNPECDTEGTDTEGPDTEGPDTEGSDTEESDIKETDTEGTDYKSPDTEGIVTERQEGDL